MTVLQWLLKGFTPERLLASFISVVLVRISNRYLGRLWPFCTLSHVPGPLYAKLSSAFLYYHAYVGDEASAVHKLHQEYGPIVRIGPWSVDIAGGDALQEIYVTNGGFRKATFYRNFEVDGHQTIFSTVSPDYRAPRAKAVLGIFSTANLRAGEECIDEAINAFVSRFRREIDRARKGRDHGKKTVDLIAVCRALAIDVVTGYLFDTKYCACEEDQIDEKAAIHGFKQDTKEDQMSASAMVDEFVAVGKLWYLPLGAFLTIEWFANKFFANKQSKRSIARVDTFITKAVQNAIDDEKHTSYPGRLLKAGFTESEVRAQCKDLVFAGTDSTAMNLATICFHLVKNPQVYQKLKEEISTSNEALATEIQSLPYLRGVVKEGLRLSMANPSRLARYVPKEGWTFKDTWFPPYTVVSCTPFELHLNPAVYPNPRAFQPERWLPENKPTDEMARDSIPFGLGTRQCIARNLATMELFCAVRRIAQEDLLDGMTCVKDRIEILEWFNSHVVGGKIEVRV